MKELTAPIPKRRFSDRILEGWFPKGSRVEGYADGSPGLASVLIPSGHTPKKDPSCYILYTLKFGKPFML